MAPDRPDRPEPGLPRHGRPSSRHRPSRHRPSPRGDPRGKLGVWLAAGIVVILVTGVTGLHLLHQDSPVRLASPVRRAATGTSGAAAGPGSQPGSTPAPASDIAAVSITDVGDMNFGMDGRYPPGGAGSLFAGVAGDLRSSLTVGNLETALGRSGTTKCKARSTECYAFQAPADSARAVHKAGFKIELPRR